MAETDDVPPEPVYGLDELSDRSGVAARTIRYYQSEGLLPKPAKNGRDAVYGAAHVERLALIAELRDHGLTLGAIRDLVATDRPSRTVAEWLGVDATLKAPWSDDRPRVMSRAELTTHVGRRAGLVAELEDAGYLQSGDADTVLVQSPALLDLALQLHDAGIDVDISGRLRDLLRARLAKAVDEAVALLAQRAGTGFAGRASPEELAKAIGVLRPIARETTGIILAQEVERALRGLLDEGPAKVRAKARRK
jgi:DNA-binding transcriptional MerR regulator